MKSLRKNRANRFWKKSGELIIGRLMKSDRFLHPSEFFPARTAPVFFNAAKLKYCQLSPWAVLRKSKSWTEWKKRRTSAICIIIISPDFQSGKPSRCAQQDGARSGPALWLKNL